MSEKFTKGEWRAVTHDGDVKHAVIYITNGGFDISNCPDAVANAHLIAAAPDMYEMLNRMQAVMYHLSNEIGLRDSKRIACRDDFSKINELLAKARGEN